MSDEQQSVERPGLPATDRVALDRTVERLVSRKDDWVREGLPGRITRLQRCLEGLLEIAEPWARETCNHKGIDFSSALAGEAWLSGPMVTLEAFRQYAKALRAGGRPRPRRQRQAPNGQTVVEVFPRSPSERFLYHNMVAEIWIEPGQAPTQGRIYGDTAGGGTDSSTGAVALVLGAGNISSIGPLDALHKLFVENEVVVLKMHPVNEYLGPLFERAFKCLIHDGYLAVVYGGRETGEYLCAHPGIDAIHLTGSDRTHDAIVWGADPAEQARRKAAGTPQTNKKITSELGCVTPIVVVPGNWSRSSIDFQAAHVAGMVAHNASFNCTAGQVLVLSRNWPQRETFLDAVKAALARTPPRRAYYPGAQERYAAFREQYPRALVLGREQPGAVPWTLIPDVPAGGDETVLGQEAFCGLIAEVSLEAASVPEYLDRSVVFCNEKLWGTLSCTVLIDRATRRRNRTAFERAIAELRYGSIGINVWSGVNYGLAATTWGAFPGHPPENIESGTGVVHNALFFDHPQKSVVRSHFRIRPKPIWFADHRTLNVLGRHLARFAAVRSPWSLLRVALSGLRG